MKAYKRMSKGATIALFAAGMIGAGGISPASLQAFTKSSDGGIDTSSYERSFKGDDVDMNDTFDETENLN